MNAQVMQVQVIEGDSGSGTQFVEITVKGDPNRLLDRARSVAQSIYGYGISIVDKDDDEDGHFYIQSMEWKRETAKKEGRWILTVRYNPYDAPINSLVWTKLDGIEDRP